MSEGKRRSRRRWWLLYTVGLVGALVVVYITNCSLIPKGVEGPGAERLLARMKAATNNAAFFERTAAVEFDFDGRHQIVWDRRRGLAEVRFKAKGARLRVQIATNRSRVVAWTGSRRVVGPRELETLAKTAYAYFINDTFWLNPVFHIDQKSARRYLVSPNELLVRFESGGVTPGDTYLFKVDERYRVRKMTMWVQIIFVKGLPVIFEDYVTTETGVTLATSHRILFYNLELKGVRMYRRYPPLGATDPFADLLSGGHRLGNK
ncbi:MAG: hypothetical protein KC609_04445 [Myxococcales bacterium]|nr:hypothetical protein [Myxococcales bacterium]